MKLREEDELLLRRSRIGLTLGDDGTRAFIEAADLKRKAKGGMLFREGDAGAGMYVILKGKVKLTRIDRDGKETLLHIADPPALIAEAAIFMGKFPASASAIDDVEALFLSKEAAFDLMEKNGRFARFLMEGMSFWLKRLVGRIEQLTNSDATARVSRYLLDLHEKNPPGITLKAPKVNLPVKKGELAQLLNMQLPSLSRIFRKLQDDGLIEVAAKNITLLNVAGLRRLTLPPLE